MARMWSIGMMFSFSCLMSLILNYGLTEGGFTFEVHLVHYENPSHGAESTGCCEEGDCTVCDNAFRFCVRERASSNTPCSGGTGDSCSLGMIETRKISNNDDDIFFSEGDSVGSRHTNPLKLFGELWPREVEICWSVYDLDLSTGIDRYSDLVARKILPVPALSPGVLTEPITFSTVRTNITMRFQLVCDEEDSVSDCSGPCVPMDNSTGHFTCDPNTGERVCLIGYQDVWTWCTQCTPPTDCSEVGGYCTQPLECLCREGYMGENCSLCKMATNCSEEGGYCTEPGECLCREGYSGENCSVCSDCEISPSSSSTTTSTIIVVLPSEEPSLEAAITEPLLSSANITIMSISGNVAIVLIIACVLVLIVLAVLARRRSQRRRQSYLGGGGALYDTVTDKVDLKKTKNKREIPYNSANDDHLYETLDTYTPSPTSRYGISVLAPTYAAVNPICNMVPVSEVEVEKNVAYEARNVHTASSGPEMDLNLAYAAVDKEQIKSKSCLKLPLPTDPVTS